MSLSILTLAIRVEHDVVLARQRARQIAGLLGFDTGEQTRIATAVSEIARNAVAYGGGGKVAFQVDGEEPPQTFVVLVQDDGPGIGDLEAVLDGRFRSTTGLGMGIVGARRLMDRFQIESVPGRGTRVLLGKTLPRRVPLVTGPRLAEMAAELAAQAPRGPIEEFQQQNQELLRTLDELRARQEQLAALNRELSDTNRGVLALYAELAEKADHLRRADELKSRFLSNMSHEFRTPLNSILALSRLLLDRTDGDLSGEQERQVVLIRKGAEELLELVNDLLDLAKVEAGRITVRPDEFTVERLFSALKGMLRPLITADTVSLVFEEPADLPPLHTDEAKVAQILRNFIVNALKFTEQGEVRVSARLDPTEDAVVFSVSDTGIGIAPEDQERIFLEFGQIEGPHQRKVRGTGLGLPLSRRLAELLGGSLSLRSRPGEGSTFSATIPRVYVGRREDLDVPDVAREIDPNRLPVLVVEDNRETLFLYQKYLMGTPYQVVPARTLAEARRVLARLRPAAVLLDVLLAGETSWDFLAALKAEPATRDIPVLVATVVDDQEKSLALGADDFVVKPLERGWLLDALARLTGHPRSPSILIVDDDEASRYLLAGLLAGTGYEVGEARGALEGLRRAREERPALIVLDLGMPDMSGFEVLDRLAADPATADIPVVIASSRVLTADERRRLEGRAVAILSKGVASREAARAEMGAALARALRERSGIGRAG